MIELRRLPLRGLAATLIVLVLLSPLVVVWLSIDIAPAESVSPPIAWRVLLASVAVAGCVAVLAMLWGGLWGVIFAVTDLRGTSLWGTLLLLPFICPHMVWALAQIYCFGAGGVWERVLGDAWRPRLTSWNHGHYISTVLVMVQVYSPLAMLLVWRGAGRLHHAGWEAAWLMLPVLQRLRWLLVSLRAEFAGAAFLVFALALGNFAIPHALQCRLYVIEIYMRASSYLDHAGAISAALPLVATSLLALALVIVVDSRSQPGSSRNAGAWRIKLGRARYCINTLLAVYVGLTVLMPITAVVIECRSLSLLVPVIRDAGREAANTLYIAASAGVWVLLACWTEQTLPWAAPRNAFRHLVVATLGVPAILIGLGYLQVTLIFTGAIGDGLRRTGILLIWALTIRAWPFAMRVVGDATRQADPIWYEAADLAGVSAWRQWRWVVWPWHLDYWLTAVLVAYILTAGEVEICQLLCEPGQGTLALRLFTFLHFGPTHVAAGLALFHLLLVCLPVLIYYLIADRCLRIV